jgi:hypothetical protein
LPRIDFGGEIKMSNYIDYDGSLKFQPVLSDDEYHIFCALFQYENNSPGYPWIYIDGDCISFSSSYKSNYDLAFELNELSRLMKLVNKNFCLEGQVLIRDSEDDIKKLLITSSGVAYYSKGAVHE